MGMAHLSIERHSNTHKSTYPHVCCSAAGFAMAGSPEGALACLGAGAALSGALCAHMTASIGGADMVGGWEVLGWDGLMDE